MLSGVMMMKETAGWQRSNTTQMPWRPQTAGFDVAAERDAQRSGVTDTSFTPSISVSTFWLAVTSPRSQHAHIVALVWCLERMKLHDILLPAEISSPSGTKRKYSLLLARCCSEVQGTRSICGVGVCVSIFTGRHRCCG
jgi:hypothetical protein